MTLDSGSDVRALELDRLITEFFALQREDTAPSAEEFIAQHPEYEHALRAVLPGASLLDRIGKRAEDATPSVRSGDHLGEYKLLGILGRGGMGVVYEAVQETLGRPVALKVLPASRVVDRKSRERFMREAQAAASLQHPGIVPVYGVGETDGQVYYAMQRIDGVPLDALSAAARGEEPSSESTIAVERATALATHLRTARLGGVSSASGGDESSASRRTAHASSTSESRSSGVGRPWIENVVRIALQAAEALSYAHSRGVLHRDVKPSNLMVTSSGRVWVTDFGLCKTTDGSSLTAAGDVVGTLRYLPPERFEGRDDARGDVYGLGMIMYELLVGRPAYAVKDRAALARAVTLQSPPRPRKIIRDIPEDLERIVLAATAKLPEERYASAEALIADLSRFLEGRPILARAPGKLYLARLFARRNRALVWTVAVATGLILLGGLVYVRDLRGLVNELEVATDAAQKASYHAELAAAASAIRAERDSIARRYLDGIPEEERDWLWHSFAARLHEPLLVVDRGAPPIVATWMGADGEHVVVSRAESVRVQSLGTGETTRELPARAPIGAALVPGGDGAVIVVDGPDRVPRVEVADDAVGISETPSAFIQAMEAAHLTGVHSMDVRGDHIAFACDDQSIAVFDTSRPGPPRVFQYARNLTFHLRLLGGDGRVLCITEGSGAVLGPGPDEMRRVDVRRRGEVVDVAVAPDADRFAVLQIRGRVSVFEDDGATELLEPVDDFNPGSGVSRITLGRRGHTCISVATRGIARVWYSNQGLTSDHVRVLGSPPVDVHWPGGGQDIVVAGTGGEWRKVAYSELRQGMLGARRTRVGFSHTAAFDVSGDGRWYASADLGGTWSVWSTERHRPILARSDELEPIEFIAVESATEGPTALALGGEALRTWARGPDPEPYHTDLERVPGVRDVVGLDWVDGERDRPELLVVERSGRLLVIGSEVGDGHDAPVCPETPERAAFASPDVRRAFVATEEGGLWRWNAGEGGPVRVAGLPAPAIALGVDRGGASVLVVTRDQEMLLYDVDPARDATIRWRVPVGEPGEVSPSMVAIALDEVGGWAITATSGGDVRTWRLDSGRPGPPLYESYGRFTGARFPRPGEPPMVQQFRGRMHTFESSDTSARSDRRQLAPMTAHERAMRSRLLSVNRLSAAEEELERADLTEGEAAALLRITSGLEFYSRYNPRILRPSRANGAYQKAREVHTRLLEKEAP